eukprot:TRINITY_DN18261_c0_g1_i4.p1 TRINITY_DN18261_c0_g1~~TRINITY_DN18261_c0_g1_i4.p1  ORF type:complete len:412 (-),score=52.95 TRINITY_DN18261_c0_g1_i4:63-1298(-)
MLLNACSLSSASVPKACGREAPLVTFHAGQGQSIRSALSEYHTEHSAELNAQGSSAYIDICVVLGCGIGCTRAVGKQSQQPRRKNCASCRVARQASGAAAPAPSDYRPPLLATGNWPEPTDDEAAAVLKEASTIPSIDARNLDQLDSSKPVKLRHLTDSWPARAWDRTSFLEEFGALRFRLRPCASLHEYGYTGPASEFVMIDEYFSRRPDDVHGVLFENDFHSAHAALKDSYSVPQLLSRVHGKPIFSAARRHTGVGFHAHDETWLAQLQGRKAWFLVPPEAPRPPTLPPWWYMRERPADMHFSVLQPGEVLYIPDGWWHATWNLDDFTLALGWEGGPSAGWNKAMHALANCDEDALLKELRGAGLEVSEEAIELAARSGSARIMKLLLSSQARRRFQRACAVFPSLLLV